MMISRRYAGPALCVAMAVTLVVWGCTQGDNPVDPPLLAPGAPSTQILGFPVLENNPWNDPTGRILSVAYASGTSLDVPQPPFPVLYLLHDYGSDGKYFERYNIQSILEDLYRKGEIGRMLVVTVDASNAFGGSYYRNSLASGQYADLIMSVVRHVEQTFRVYTQGGRSSRAISGHGMGGYGAMRFAMDRPDLFASVSSMSGPLSFGGSDGRSGVLNWTTEVFRENHVPDSAFSTIFPGLGKRFTNQIIAMAVAFSPRPLEELVSPSQTRFDSCQLCLPKYKGACIPENWWEFYYCKPCSLYESVDPGPATLLFPTLQKKRLCSDSLHRNPAPIGIDLPFDSSGQRSDLVWAKWEAQDVKSLFELNPHVFDSTAVYLDCGDADEWGFLDQNLGLLQAMKTAGQSHFNDSTWVWEQYSGFGGVDAGHSQLVQERLREILKFHDKRFGHSPGPRP